MEVETNLSSIGMRDAVFVRSAAYFESVLFLLAWSAKDKIDGELKERRLTITGIHLQQTHTCVRHYVLRFE